MIPVLEEDSTVGTVADMAARIRSTLPTGWFPASPPAPAASATPVLDGLLTGLGSAWAFCFGLLSTVAAQTRISSAAGSFLDMISVDFFGSALPRGNGEIDRSFRLRINANLLMRRGTRQDVENAVAQVTSVTPLICEPTQASDCGGYGGSGDATAGRGGYCTPGSRYGSDGYPFQYFVKVPASASFAAGVITRREATATFIDANGLIQFAAPMVLRPNYQDGTYVGPLLEGRGFNLISDSRGWTGFAQSPVSGGSGASWVNQAAATALFAADAVLQVTGSVGVRVPGPSVDVAAGDATVTASCWTFIPPGSGLSAVELAVTDLNRAGSTVYAAADLTQVGRWQRLSSSLQMQAAAGRNLRVGLLLTCPGGTVATVTTQCWQVEPGATATSYIPTSGTLGIRAPDDVINMQVSGSSVAFTEADVLDAVASTIPAATIAWTAVFPAYVPAA